MYIGDFYLSWILIVSSCVAALGIIIMLAKALVRRELSIFGFVLVLVAAIVGFGLLGAVYPVKIVNEEITDYEVAFTTSTVTLAFDEYAQLYYDAKTYNILSDKFNAIVYYEIQYNSYNKPIDTPSLYISKR